MKYKQVPFPLMLIAGILIVTGSLVFAQSSEDVTSDLRVYKVELDKNKKEILSLADQAKPGDILEYQVLYGNKGKSDVFNLRAILPIPEGLSYLQDTASPSLVEASLDGQKFDRVPLKRIVKRPDGKLMEENVPYSEYRYLGWQIGQLNAGKNVQAKARMILK